jgi:hypothetical protein
MATRKRVVAAPAEALQEAPTTELGSSNPHAGSSIVQTGTPSWSYFYGDDLENVPELMWPQSVRVYHMMRNDAQVQGLFNGCVLPIRRYRWMLDPNGAKAEVVNKFSEDYGLPIEGEEPRKQGRKKRRFSFAEHLRIALLACAYGHMPFEQVGDIWDTDEFPKQDGLWHVRKLAERMPNTLIEIATERDGGIRHIKQLNALPGDPPIPINRLLWYVWEREGANWAGRSMLRCIYKNWLIKDRTLRVGTINIERAGAGTPVATAPPGATKGQIQELNRMAQGYKAGEAAGGALPYGASLTLEGIRGGQPDAAGWVRLQNEEMSRGFLEMFMQLGQTETGSRSLGDSFIDFFNAAQEAVANWFVDTFNAHQLEDDADWNYGEGEPVPLVKYVNEDPELAIEELASLVDSKIIEVDDELETSIRERFKLPDKGEPRVQPVPPMLPPAGEEEPEPEPEPSPTEAGRRREQRAAPQPLATSGLALPTRALRRQPYDHEVRAQVDFAEMEAQFTSNRDALVFEVSQLQTAQIEELHDAIADAGGDLTKLAAIAATANAADAIYLRSLAMAEQGATQALNEANRQGVDEPKRGDVDKLSPLMRNRAEATAALLAQSLSEAAGRKALALSGGAIEPSAVAAEVRTYLNSLSNTYLDDQLGGVLTQAMNTGRRSTFEENEPESYHASELLDTAACANCIAKDGTQYLDLTEAEKDYPTGGYKDCLGGPRCRGSLVAVYEESAPTLEEPFGGEV